jgi:FkbM family methyltransferase
MFYMRMLMFFGVLTSLLVAECEQYPARFEGFFEQYGGRRLDLIAQFLPYAPVIFEAGGHYGIDTIKIAKRWPRGTVISFEPNPNAFKLLSEATQDTVNIHAYNLAVNTYNGTAILNICYGTNGNEVLSEGASSLLEPSEWMKIHYKGPKVEVPCVVLDDWCQSHEIDHIDFMWLDLEGLELQVLKSSPRILEKVNVIYTETNFLEFRLGMTQFTDLKTHLENSGFKMLSHWYYEGLQGDAIFVKRELFELVF